MPTFRHPALAAAAMVAGLAATLATPIAQSQNPFGVPSADQPQPGAAIKAVPGSRAQGWLSQGRSEVLARHGHSPGLLADSGLCHHAMLRKPAIKIRPLSAGTGVIMMPG